MQMKADFLDSLRRGRLGKQLKDKRAERIEADVIMAKRKAMESNCHH